MEIRVAEIDDAEQLSVIGTTVWIASYCTHGVNHNLASYVLSELSPLALRELITQQRVFVAQQQGHLLGYGVIESQSAAKAELKNLYVLPGFQGRGVGAALLRACRDFAGSGLWLTCWEKNDSARQFYRRNGLVESGEAWFFVDGQQHRNIVYETAAVVQPGQGPEPRESALP